MILPSERAVAEQGYGFLFLLDYLYIARFDKYLYENLKKKTILLWGKFDF